MKRFIKISLVVIFFLAIIGSGTAYYFLKMKKYDVADEQVDQIIEDPYSVSFPESTPLPDGVQQDTEGLVIVNKDGDFVLESGEVLPTAKWFESSEYAKAAVAAGISSSQYTQASNTSSAGAEKQAGGEKQPASNDSSSTAGQSKSNDSTPSNSNSTGSKPAADTSKPNNGANEKAPANRPTASSIKARYAGSFGSLQGQAQGQINSLIGQAKSEYDAKKAAGETVNPAYFYQKYSGAAANVEAKTDAAFNTLYNSMKSELKANGLSTAAADEYKAQYEAQKESMRNSLLSKAAGN